MRRTAPLLLVVTVLLLANVRVATPYHNWDVLGYTGVALGWLGVDQVDRHARAYDAVRAGVPAAAADDLVRGPYRASVAADPDAFSQQLPFYAVKPLYPLAMSGLMRLGLGPVEASLALSRAGYVATGLILFLWLATLIPPGVAAGVTWVMASTPFMVQLARLSTPDSLATAAIVAALFLASRGRWSVALPVVVASLLLRPDNVVWLPALVLACAFSAREHLRAALAWTAAGGVVVLLVSWWAGGYGWSTLFAHTFLGYMPTPAATPVDLPLGRIVREYAVRSFPSYLPHFLLPFSVLAAGVAWLRARDRGLSDPWVALLVAGLAQTGVHWLIFPGEERFNVAFYLLVTAAASVTLSRARLPEAV